MKTRRLLPLVAIAMLASCQTQPIPRGTLPPAGVGAQAAGRGLIDDTDIGGAFRPQDLGRLQQEAIARRGDELTFATVARRPVSRLQRAGLSVGGRLVFADRTGQARPAALATAGLYQGERKLAAVLTDADGRWTAELPAPGHYQVRYTLENPRWKISKYSWKGPEADIQAATDFGETGLQSGSTNGQAAWIHEVFLKALALFEREQVPLDWWKRQISTVWPGSGNYYSSYTVNLTAAEAWDVNGHEIGHALYDQALNADMQGGQHKIDECYSPTLAMSEGFATFISGAIHLSKDDPDAHFDQFLVPRRAPIRIENVPEDVCRGERNEWRVASAFWEIYDSHADGADQLSLGLKTIIGALGQNSQPTVESATDAYKLLLKALPAGQQAALKAAFAQNTMEVR
ncbi:MAG TPA: hypothetical protein V6D23_23055 [Candidatus Obscuribacterales bacterium]